MLMMASIAMLLRFRRPPVPASRQRTLATILGELGRDVLVQGSPRQRMRNYRHSEKERSPAQTSSFSVTRLKPA